VLARARHVSGIRRRTDIERQQIVRDRRAAAADRAAAGKIKVDDLVLVETRPGKTGQRTGVDMGFVDTVIAGDESGQHAGIGCVHLAADQGKAHARDRLHAELAQHRNVGVAGADQHDVLQHGMARALHVGLSSHEGSECW
jgi:hypothetical protein